MQSFVWSAASYLGSGETNLLLGGLRMLMDWYHGNDRKNQISPRPSTLKRFL